MQGWKIRPDLKGIATFYVFHNVLLYFLFLLED